MILTLDTERLRTLEQVRAFMEGNRPVDFRPGDRGDVYEFARRTLVRFRYADLEKPAKGLVKRYLGKVTGLSRAQLTRLIGQYRAPGASRTAGVARHGRSSGATAPPTCACSRRSTGFSAAFAERPRGACCSASSRSTAMRASSARRRPCHHPRSNAVSTVCPTKRSRRGTGVPWSNSILTNQSTASDPWFRSQAPIGVALY